MSDDRYQQAMTNLDQAGAVMAAGATIAPDFVMRAIIAFRAVLQEHPPITTAGLTSDDGFCRQCHEEVWPCLTARPVLDALGVEVDEDD